MTTEESQEPVVQGRRKTVDPSADSPAKVLVADDQMMNRALLGKLLEKQGISYHTALNGEEAVKKVLSNDYTIVIMDLRMPVLNGVNAMKRIRATPGYEDLVIIALSGLGMEERDKALEAGFNDYLMKPIRMRDLDDILDKYSLGGEQLRSGTRKLDREEDGEPGEDIEDDIMIKSLQAKFLVKFGSQLEEMRDALRSRNYDRLANLGHIVKGTAGILKFTRMCQLGAWLQTNAGPGMDTLILKKLAELEECYIAEREKRGGKAAEEETA